LIINIHPKILLLDHLLKSYEQLKTLSVVAPVWEIKIFYDEWQMFEAHPFLNGFSL